MQTYNPVRKSTEDPKFNNPEQIAYDLALIYAQSKFDKMLLRDMKSGKQRQKAELLEDLVKMFVYAYGYYQQQDSDKLLDEYKAYQNRLKDHPDCD